MLEILLMNGFNNFQNVEPYTDKDYLPDEIQPELNGETMAERIGAINEEAEREAVSSVGGFYIARFEAGQEETETLVSKKNASVWSNISQEEAKNRAKDMIDTTHAKTALCSGIQWDVVMGFVDGKLDGATPAQKFNVSIGAATRRKDAPTNTGINEADKVCNIYDLEANHIEFVAENSSIEGSERPLLRGDYNYEISSELYASACSRARLLGQENEIASFRVVLYVL